MLNRVGSYYETSSLIHKMNCVIKVICTIMFAILSTLSTNFYINVLIFILLSLLLLLSNIPIRNYLYAVYKIKFLLVFIFVINIIFERDFYLSTLITLRVVYLLLYTMMFIFTTKSEEIVYGLEKVFAPLKIFKIPVNKMAFSISLALRFIPNLNETLSKIIKSQVNRGIYYKDLKLGQKIDLLKISIIPMFILSIKRADMLSESMEVRLYDINNSYNYVDSKFDYFDLFIVLIHVAILALAIRKGFFL